MKLCRECSGEGEVMVLAPRPGGYAETMVECQRCSGEGIDPLVPVRSGCSVCMGGSVEAVCPSCRAVYR